MRAILAAIAVASAVVASGCGDRCGPSRGVVAFVTDGDTLTLETGEQIRYLMVDAPETTGGKTECWGPQARSYNEELVLGREVTLTYDEQCTDQFDRLLAYVSVEGVEVNSRLVELGYACVLHIPPNGTDRLEAFTALQADAKSKVRGLWTCEPLPPCTR